MMGVGGTDERAEDDGAELIREVDGAAVWRGE